MIQTRTGSCGLMYRALFLLLHWCHTQYVGTTAYLSKAVSNGTSRVGFLPPAHLGMDTDPVSETLCWVEYRMMEKVRNPVILNSVSLL
jgi:hypothetical protein